MESYLDPLAAPFAEFEQCTPAAVEKVIQSAASKSSSLDPNPTTILKEFLLELLPFVMRMCNMHHYLRLSQRRAIVNPPRLKIPGSDASDVKNYQPISNLSFMSKVFQRLVCQQLLHFLEKHNLLPKCQSAYRRYHSMETAVLKIVCDALSAAKKGEVTFLGMLDMSAAFDTVNHDILLKRLHMSFGICGAALSWISSFVRHRTQTIAVNGKMSDTSLVTCGVLQASVLGPILFMLYTVDVAHIVEMHGINFHSYADDSELYLLAKADEIALTLPRVILVLLIAFMLWTDGCHRIV